ncbi:Proteasome assembly chaperone 1 [Chamberlinius hualienensis]
MATYFGEVLPVTSRAIDDDDDDDNVNECRKPSEAVIQWSLSTENQLISSNHLINCSLLIFATNPSICAFVRRYYLPTDAKPIAVVSCGVDNKTKNTVLQNSESDNSCFIYKLSDNLTALTVLWQHSASPESVFVAINKLFKKFHLDQLKVVILSSSITSDYISPYTDDTDEIVIRSLSSDANKEVALHPRLEVPNSITGFPAHVLTYCQVHDIPAILYVVYHDVMENPSNFSAWHQILTPYKLLRYTNKDKSINVLTQNSVYI